MAHSEIRRKIGGFLKERREQARMSIQDASNHVELMNEKQLLEIEQGLAPISLSDIYAFANIYNIEPNAVINLIIDVTAMDPMTQEKDLNLILNAYN